MGLSVVSRLSSLVFRLSSFIFCVYFVWVTNTVLRVDGMNCEKCVRAVVRALEGLPGVSSARATLEGRQAMVEHESGQPRLEQMVGILERDGYGVRASGAG